MNREQYVNHSLGIMELFQWLAQYDKQKGLYKLGDSCIMLNEVISRSFFLGMPRKRAFGRLPFLSVQPKEKSWLNKIQWSRVILNLDECRLYMIAERQNGNGDDLPDIPAVAFSIIFDLRSKLETIVKFKDLDVRGVWFDEESNIQVGNGAPITTVPIFIQDSSEPLFTKEELAELRSEEALFHEKLASLGWGNNSEIETPGFNGTMGDIPEDLRKLFMQ